MPSALVSAEVLLAVLLLAVLVTIAVTFWRRRHIARGSALIVCGLCDEGRAMWRIGLLRMGASNLEWYALGGVSIRPVRLWHRGDLEVCHGELLPQEDGIPVLPDALRVPCRTRQESFELAMPAQAYVALRTWAESAPPSFNTDITIA